MPGAIEFEELRFESWRSIPWGHQLPNPWGLSTRDLLVVDAVGRLGSAKAAARCFGLEAATVTSVMRRVFGAMRMRSSVQVALELERWRMQRAADARAAQVQTFLQELVSPEGLGHAVSLEVRRKAGRLLSMWVVPAAVEAAGVEGEHVDG